VPNSKSRLFLIFATVAAITLASVAIVYWMGLRVAQANADCLRSLQVIETLDSTLSLLKDAETGQRGFLLTGDEKYLEPYNATLPRIGAELDELASLAAHGELPPASVQHATRLAQAKLEELANTIQLRRLAGLDAALAVVRTDAGKHSMDDLRAQVAQLRRHAQDQFDRRDTDRDRTVEARVLVSVLMGLVILLFLFLAYRSLLGGLAAEERRRFIESASAGEPLRFALPRWTLYALALLLVAAATGLRLFLDPWLGPAAIPFVTFNAAIVLAALIGGARPGLLATLISTLTCIYLIIPPRFSFALSSSAEFIPLTIFFATGLVVSILAGRLHETRRIARERADSLSLSEQRLRFALEGMHAGAWDLDLTNHSAHRSLQHDQIFGYDALLPQWTYEMFIEHVIPEDRPLVDARFRQCIAAGKDWNFECRIIRKDGVERWIWAVGHCHNGADGKPARVVGIVLDITDRKAAEEKFHLYLHVLLATANAIVITDPRGAIEWVNPAFTTLTGYSAAEALGQNPRILNSRQHDPAFFATMWQTIHAGRPWQGELINRRKDGALYSEEMTITPVTGPAGEIVHYIAVKQDITPRKRAEADRAQNERRFQTLADAIPQLTWMAHADGFIYWYNRRWYEYTGTTPAQMEGWGWQSVHDPNVLPQVMEKWQAAIAAGEPFEMTFPLRGADGVFRLFLTRAIPLIDPDGRVVQWFGTNTDVTDLQQAAQNKALLAAIVESSDAAIFSIDLTGSILIWNAGAQRLFGYDSSEIVGRPLQILVPPDRAAAEQEFIDRLRRGQAIQQVETVHVTKDGRHLDVSVIASPLIDDQGRVYGASKIVRDITERKRAQEALARTSEDLARSNKDLEQFAYVASHDLQEPLRMVTGYLQLLDRRYKDKLDQDAIDFINFAVDGATRMSRLITDLLDFSRINSRGRPPEPVALDAVLRHAQENLAFAIREANAEIIADPLPVVRGDATQLVQLFQNLLGNALKFRAPERPQRICIRAEKEADSWRLSVADQGIGIDPQYADKIFLIFQRLHSRAEYPGTGIGLALCKKIVERHGGRIWVEGRLGEGTTFFFTLPAA
jgi:PAS domain S-box-containing protein